MDTKSRRQTRQRQAILEELRARRCHPTASELFQAVRGRLPSISLGTVYRNLEVLAETGQVVRMRDGGAETRFDGNPLPHAHIYCTSCEQLVDLDVVVPELAQLTGAEVVGFLITSHHVTLHGICDTCRNLLRNQES
jgi:Fe2+ or Zn2+ uptake regulation protein